MESGDWCNATGVPGTSSANLLLFRKEYQYDFAIRGTAPAITIFCAAYMYVTL